MRTRGWFADIDTEAGSGYQWQPCLETDTGHIPALPIWFANEAECIDWIREFVADVGILGEG